MRILLSNYASTFQYLDGSLNMARKRPNDAFVKQIKKIAKQLAWRAG